MVAAGRLRHLVAVIVLFATSTLGGAGKVRSGGGRGTRKDHEDRVKVPASKHLVQELAAFAIEEFVSHAFRTPTYR